CTRRVVARREFVALIPALAGIWRIGARDRYAARKIAELREKFPNAAIVALFGEAHLAPGHLPRWLRQSRPADRILTVLQNVDELYWKSAGELSEMLHAVQVSEDVACV